MTPSAWIYVNAEVKTTDRKQKTTNKKTANLVGVAPSSLWTYQEMAQRACYHFPAPCWGEARASAWCIYCSAKDTNEDPARKNDKINIPGTSGQTSLSSNTTVTVKMFSPRGREKDHLFDFLYRPKVQNNVADTFILLCHRVNRKALKFDGRSLKPRTPLMSTRMIITSTQLNTVQYE